MRLHNPFRYSLNKNGGLYVQGKGFSYEKKIEVERAYEELKRASNGKDPTPTELYKKTKVSWDYAKKVIDELETEDHLLSPEEIRQRSARPKGVGVFSVSPEEEVLLLWLRFVDPSRSNESYQRELLIATGRFVSTSFISQWFDGRYNFKGKFRTPSLTPLDKFKPENIARYHEFINITRQIHPLRWKFADEKHIVGTDLFFRRVRADPVTGAVDPLLVDGDFRSTYNLIAAMGCDVSKSPIIATVGEENGTAASFLTFMEYLVGIGWFNRGDVLVLDNWIGHYGGAADVLEDFLWDVPGPDGLPLNMLVLFLPTRSPELNPIELVFQTLVQRLKNVSLENRPHNEAVLFHVHNILSEMNHELMIKSMIHCGY